MKEANSALQANKLNSLVLNTEKMCDMIVEERQKAYATGTAACNDKPAARAAFALADMQINGRTTHRWRSTYTVIQTIARGYTKKKKYN